MDKRRMCPNCRAFITTDDKVCPYCEATLRARRYQPDATGILASLVPQAQFATVTILILNVGLFLASVVASLKAGNSNALMNLDPYTLIGLGSTSRPGLAMGQWWRLITAGFLHGGLFHIALNSWALYDVGAHVEEVYGAKRLTSIYLLSTIGGFFASTLWNPGISVGASAGLFGLIGAMIALGMTEKSFHASMIRGFYIRWAIYGLLMGLLPFFHVDNAAHIGGLATGFVVAWIARTPRLDPDNWREKLWSGMAAGLVALAGYSFVLMYLYFSRLTR